MSLIIADGFDNYETLTDFYDSAGDSVIRLNTGDARTGIGCLQIRSGSFGPLKSIGQQTHILWATNWFSDQAGCVMRTKINNNVCVACFVLPDGSLQFARGDLSHIIATTAASGLVVFNSYVSIAVEIQNFTIATGIITAWVNGVQVLHATGLHTNAGDNPGDTPNYCNQIQLSAPGGIPFTLHDDFYLLDCTQGDNTTFLGALRLYALPPTANATPLDWTPLAGTNWSEVNEVPPDGDTSYNSSDTVGAIDQYVYPLTGPPAGASLLFVQHELDMKVAGGGSRSVASNLEGHTSTAVALSSGYHIYPTPYDTNPDTGVAFVAADFPVEAGPEVTA